MKFNEKTEISFNPSQAIGFVVLIFGIGAGFSVVGSDAKKAIQTSTENKQEIELLKKDVNLKAAETLKMFYEIRESQARIEEQLKQKMDK